MRKYLLVGRFARCVPHASSVVLSATLAFADAPGPNAPPIQVIAIRSDDAEDQADALTAALRNRVRALRGFSLGDGDYALEVLTLGLKCGEVPDEACQVRIGNHIRADRYVWGHVKRSKSPKQVTAELHLWTRGHPSSRTEITFSEGLTTPGDDGLRRLADEALAILLERQKAAPATATPPSTPSNTTSGSVVSPPASSAAVATTPAPNASSPEGASAKPSAESDDTTRSSDTRVTLGWMGIGLGGALVAAGIYSVVRANDIESDERVDRYRQGFRPEVDACDQAEAGMSSKVAGAATPEQMRDFCSSAGTFQTLEYVFFGLGALSAGAGVYLLATDGNASAARAGPRLTVKPTVTPSSGRVQIGFRF